MSVSDEKANQVVVTVGFLQAAGGRLPELDEEADVSGDYRSETEESESVPAPRVGGGTEESESIPAPRAGGGLQRSMSMPALGILVPALEVNQVVVATGGLQQAAVKVWNTAQNLSQVGSFAISVVSAALELPPVVGTVLGEAGSIFGTINMVSLALTVVRIVYVVTKWVIEKMRSLNWKGHPFRCAMGTLLSTGSLLSMYAVVVAVYKSVPTFFKTEWGKLLSGILIIVQVIKWAINSPTVRKWVEWAKENPYKFTAMVTILVLVPIFLCKTELLLIGWTKLTELLQRLWSKPTVENTAKTDSATSTPAQKVSYQGFNRSNNSFGYLETISSPTPTPVPSSAQTSAPEADYKYQGFDRSNNSFGWQ
jgi:hypothetical protein